MARGYKTGGRTEGTPNKLTKELRTALKNLLAQEFENIPDQMQTLQPKDRLELIIKLLPYVLPRVESVEMDEGEPLGSRL